MKDDIEILKPGDPCPLCGQPIQTDDEGTLNALTMVREWLEIGDAAHMALLFIREQMRDNA